MEIIGAGLGSRANETAWNSHFRQRHVTHVTLAERGAQRKERKHNHPAPNVNELVYIQCGSRGENRGVGLRSRVLPVNLPLTRCEQNCLTDLDVTVDQGKGHTGQQKSAFGEGCIAIDAALTAQCVAQNAAN